MSASAADVGLKVICADGWRVTMHVEVRRGPLQGPIVSARDLPTGCQQQYSLVVPTVRAPRCLTEPSAKSPQKQPTKRPKREPSAGRRVGCLAQESKRDPGWRSKPEEAPRVARPQQSARHPTAPRAAEPFRDPPGEAIGVATSAGYAEGELMRSSSVRASSSRS
jgi:hypothetical protein